MKIRVVCPTCGAIYNVPEERVTAAKVHATCKVCGARVEFAKPEQTTEAAAYREEEAPSAEDDRPTRQQVLTPIPQEPEERETNTWQKAIIDNREADEIVGTIEGTIPPERKTEDRVPLDPSTGLGNQTIRAAADINDLFPEQDPQPPPHLRPAPSAQTPSAPPKRARRRRRGRRSRVPMVLLVISFLIVAAAALYYFRDEIMSAL